MITQVDDCLRVLVTLRPELGHTIILCVLPQRALVLKRLTDHLTNIELLRYREAAYVFAREEALTIWTLRWESDLRARVRDQLLMHVALATMKHVTRVHLSLIILLRYNAPGRGHEYVVVLITHH